MIREWRYIKMMKRFARAYADNGVEGAQRGDLAVACPICPRPGVNLPDSWDSKDNPKRYVPFYSPPRTRLMHIWILQLSI